METCFAFLDYVKAFDRVKRDKLFEILQSKNIPNLLLKSAIEIDFGNKIKVKLLEEHIIHHGIRQGCPLSPTLFIIYVNRIIVKWYQICTKGIRFINWYKNTHSTSCIQSSHSS